MKEKLPDGRGKKSSRGLRPAIAVEAFVVILVLCLLLWGKLGTWFLNWAKGLFGH